MLGLFEQLQAITTSGKPALPTPTKKVPTSFVEQLKAIPQRSAGLIEERMQKVEAVLTADPTYTTMMLADVLDETIYVTYQTLRRMEVANRAKCVMVLVKNRKIAHWRAP